jgi:hypothetical protein
VGLRGCDQFAIAAAAAGSPPFRLRRLRVCTGGTVEPRVIRANWQLFAVVVIAQLCDFATFMMGIARVGIGAEQNVLVRNLYLSFGAAGPLLLKVVTLGAVLSLLVFVAARWQSRVLVPVLIAVIVSMIGVYGNVANGLAA